MSVLEIENMTAFYSDFQALFGVSLNIEKGETVHPASVDARNSLVLKLKD